MKQRKRARPHLERVQFVVGMQNAGKSHLLRSMFADSRLGTRGEVPTASRIALVPLSTERCLHVRLTSPHEVGETLTQFLRKLDRAMARAWSSYWRFNFACAAQPNATEKTPDIASICAEVRARLVPERIRVVQIHPRQDDQEGDRLTRLQVDQLFKLGVEVIAIDARRQPPSDWTPNGYVLADFFDFS